MRLVQSALLVIVSGTLMACAKGGSPSEGPPPYRGRPLKATDFPTVKNTPYGSWAADQADFRDGIYYVLNIHLNDQGDVGLSRTCGGGGEVINAGMVLNGNVTATQIEITESATVTERSSKIADCSVSVQAGAINYRLQPNDKLEIEVGPGDVRSFSRF